MNTREMSSVAALFGSQDGLATITQLSERGVTPGLLRQRLASEEWGRIGRGVITVGSAPPSWRRSVRAAVLAAGPHSFVSHATAARLHGFDGYQRANRIIISGVEGHHVRSIEGVEVHRSTVLDNEHRRLVAGISCAIEPVALIQIAATDGRDSAAQALDSYLRDGKSAEWVRFVATPLVRPKFGGPRIVLELLRERVEARLPRSWFQRTRSATSTAHSWPNSISHCHRCGSVLNARAGDGTRHRGPRRTTTSGNDASERWVGRYSNSGGRIST